MARSVTRRSRIDAYAGLIPAGNARCRGTDHVVRANVPILNQVVPHTDYLAQCESSLSSRRAWSVPVALIGAVAVVAALLLRGRMRSCRWRPVTGAKPSRRGRASVRSGLDLCGGVGLAR
jgi:hypothetical protein